MSQPVHFSCAEIREFDRRAIEEFHIPGIILMENAGRVLTEHLCSLIDITKKSKSVLIVAGPGNNGGDGFVMARHLQRLSYRVRVVAVGNGPENWKGDAAVNLNALEKLTDDHLKIFYFRKDNFDDSIKQFSSFLEETEIVVDAILGTGAYGPPRFPVDEIINIINNSRKTVFSVDIPSGLNGDTGEAAVAAIQAKMTCTLAAPKHGFLKESAAKYIGKLSVGDIGVDISKLSAATLEKE